MKNASEGKKTEEKREGTREEKEDSKKTRGTILDQLTRRQRTGSLGTVESLSKRKREEEERAQAEAEILGKFEKARKITRSPTRKDTTTKTEAKSKVEVKEEEDKKKMEQSLNEIKEFMRDIKEELRSAREEIRELKDEWRKKEQRWEGRIKEVEDKIEKMTTETGLDEEMQEKIKKLEILEEARERKEKRNNIIIKGWEAQKRDSLESEVTEMLKKELNAEVRVEEAFWTKRGTNMITAKLENKDQKREIMTKKKNLKGKRIFIDNDLTWKERQVQKEIWKIAEEEKGKGAKVKIGYRKIEVNGKKFAWKEEEGLKEQFFWNGQGDVGS